MSGADLQTQGSSTPSVAAPAEPAQPTPAVDGVQLAWRLFTSPRTIAVLTALIAALLFAGAVVPQGLDRLDLLERYPFHLVDAIRAFGVDSVFTSWTFMLAALLLVLSVVGLGLRVALARRGARAEATHHGPFTEYTEVTLREPLSAVASRLPGALGGRANVEHAADRVAARRGLHAEGLVLVAIGVAGLLASLVINHTSALDARVVHDVGHALVEDANLRVSIRDGDLRIDRAPPFQLLCAAPDPQDPARRHRCRYTSADAGSLELELAPGRPATAGPLTLELLSQRRLAADGLVPFAFLVRDAEGLAARLVVEPGITAQLRAGAQATPPSGGEDTPATHALTAFPGPDGPLVAFTPAGARPILLAPRLDPLSGAAAVTTPLNLEWLPPARLTAAASTHPERYLVWGSLALVALGLLLMSLVPHLVVELTPQGEATRVSVTSANRAGSAHALLARLNVAGSGPATVAPAPPLPAGGLTRGRPAVLLAATALALAGVAFALGAMGPDPVGAHAVLAGAAVLAVGGHAALALAVLAVLVALGTPPVGGAPLPWWLALSGALALGALARAAEPAARVLAAPGRRFAAAAVLAVALAVSLLLPDGYALLADPSGGVLAVDAVLRDGVTAARAVVAVPVVIPHTQPVHGLGGWTALLAGVAAITLLAWRASERAELKRPAWLLALLAGAVAALFALVGLLELLVGVVSLPDAEALRGQLTLEAGFEASIERLVVPPTAQLALWSRPVVDAVRLVLGLSLALFALRALVPGSRPAAPTTAALRFSAPRWAPLAAAACALSAPFAPTPLALGLTASALLILGALVAGRFGAPREVVAPGLLVASAAVLVATWLGPLAGWLPG